MSVAYVVTGRSDSGEIHPRLEIRDLPAHPEQWTLFILALSIIQKPDFLQSSTLGIFSALSFQVNAGNFLNIGGIHGLPYERWPGDPIGGTQYPASGERATAKNNTVHSQEHPGAKVRIKDNSGDDGTKESTKDQPSTTSFERFGGYCRHASVLFPPWHRPLVMAIEQSIGEIATALAQRIKEQYPDEEAKWTTAAKQLRFPFWDWTQGDTLPALFRDPKVSIVLPGSTKTTRSVNPLSSFSFGTATPNGFNNVKTQIPGSSVEATAYYSDWQRTCRWPESKKDANDDYKTLDQNLRNHHGHIVRSVGNLFAFPANSDDPSRMWDQFSNTSFQSSQGKVKHDASCVLCQAIEAPHNSIHTYTGGLGHMGDPDYAGFDPLFYLHHANVDRIYALWEYVYPEYWMGSGYKDEQGNLKFFTQGDGTITTLSKSRLDQASDLVPFRKDIDSYWTASDARSLLHDSPTPKWYTYPAVEGIQVDQPVTNTAELALFRRKLQKHFRIDPTPMDVKHLPNLFSRQPRLGTPDGKVLIKKYRHVVISVALVEHALGRSYTLEVEYETADGRVEYGHVAVFARATGTQCANCIARRAAGNIVHGIINLPAPHLLDMLSQYDGHRGHDGELDFVRKRLTARIRTSGGHVYATAKQDTIVPEGRALDGRIAPKMSLHTAFACRSAEGDEDETPVEFFGWEDHGELFVDKWEKA